MKYSNFLLMIFIGIFSFNCIAEQLELDYKSFYSHVRKLDNEQMNLLQFSFGFQNIETGKLCEITAARISTQKKQIPIEVTAENRFHMPTERVLRLADAKVILELAEPTNKCDMSVQLETKNSELKNYYTQQDLASLYSQYAAFFEDMGGFLSFMMPSVSGLVFHFEDGKYQTLANGMSIENGRLEVEESQLADLRGINFTEKPLRITALTQSL